ncbi:MAG: GAF domain-containing protein, partial [Pleurocapsa sp.]
MLQSEHSELLNDLSWEKTGQTIVDGVGQLLDIDIAILHINKLPSQAEQYFFYQKFNAEISEIDSDLLKLTVTPCSEFSLNNLIINQYEAQKSVPQINTSYQACMQAKIRSTVSISLLSQSNLSASLTIHRLQEFDCWQEQEVAAVRMMANQASLLIAQMLAREKLQELAHRETTLNRITATIRSSLEPPVMFAAIAQELGEALKVDGCTLSLWTKSDRFVKCVGLYNPHEPQ